MVKLLNAFSLNMISAPAEIAVEPISVERVRTLAEDGIESAVGHADTAAVFSKVLGISVPMNRATVTLSRGDQVVVGQYKGPRLPEGATELPDGATIQWLLVTVR